MSHYDDVRDEVAPIERLRALIAAAADVKFIHGLRELPGGRFAYLIQTPFMTWPRFVVGTTDAVNVGVKILMRCDSLAAAQEQFAGYFKPVLMRMQPPSKGGLE